MTGKGFGFAAVWALATAMACSISAPTWAKAAEKPGAAHRIVLPSAVTPDHYRVEITPDAKAMTFTGSVEIDVMVHTPTSKIVLNTADIVIDKAALSGEANAPGGQLRRQGTDGQLRPRTIR